MGLFPAKTLTVSIARHLGKGTGIALRTIDSCHVGSPTKVTIDVLFHGSLKNKMRIVCFDLKQYLITGPSSSSLEKND